MTLARDLINDFRTKIRDTDPQEYLWKDDEVLELLDQAQNAFFIAMEGKPRSVEAEFDHDGNFLADDTLMSVIDFADPNAGDRCCDVKFPILRKIDGCTKQGFVRDGGRYTWFSKYGDLPPRGLIAYCRWFPKEPITSMDSVVETHRTHHKCLVWHMMAEAYRNQDTETYDRSQAEELEARFLRYSKTMKAKYVAGSMIQI